jgi:uncharacterized protein (TIRG00374 family)
MADELTPWTVTLSPPARKAVRWQPSFFGLLRMALPILAAVAVLTALQERERGRVATLIAAHLPWLPLVLLPFAVGMCLDAASLWMILSAGGRPLRFLSVLRVRMAAEGALFTLPAGSLAAEALKPALLRRRCGIPLATGAAAVALNKSFIVLTNAVYLLIGLAAGGRLIAAMTARSPWARALPAVTVAAAAGCLLVGGALLLAVRRADLIERICRRLPRRWQERARQGAAQQAMWNEAMAAFWRRDRRALLCASCSLLHWLVEAFETYAVIRLLGLAVDAGAAVGFESLVALARSLAFFLPAGIGVQDSGHLLLVNLSGATDASVLGAAFVLVKRSKELLWTLVAALLIPVASSGENHEHP